MNKSWRPDGWKNPYIDWHKVSIGKHSYKIPVHPSAVEEEIFEAGASAMLEVLFRLAQESPTKTFCIDARPMAIYQETQ